VAVVLNSHLLGEVELVCDRVAILRDGSIVADGAPADLARPRGVEIDTDTGTVLVPGARRADVPKLVADLVERGTPVYGVRILAGTLEEVYLEAVGGATS
jgi:ABC-2 type transport system ATP-binding protein